MPTQQLPGVRQLDTPDELSETRLEAIGFIFHGTAADSNGKRAAPRAASNLLHFARCSKLERAGETETKIWFRSIRLAVKYLDEKFGHRNWKWCKICEREITQRILDQA